MSNILVTGAAGFIGYHVSAELLRRSHSVIGIDNLNDYYDVNLKRSRLAHLSATPGFSFQKLDVADRGAMSHMFERSAFDRVVHLAAQAGVRYSLENPHAYVDSNVVGFLNILEGCRHTDVPHLLYASSSSVYGANTDQPFSTHEAVSHPLSLYAATKLANEAMAHSYSDLFGLPTTGLRFFTVYGPWGRPDMAMYKFVKAIDEAQRVQLYNRGDMERDFTFISDAVYCVAELLDKVPTPDAAWSSVEPDPASSRAPYRIHNVGTHQPVRIAEVISLIEELTGQEARKELLPMQPGDVPSTRADTGALEAAIGRVPATPLREGISLFYEWYRGYNG